MKTCWICDFKPCPYPVCYEQEGLEMPIKQTKTQDQIDALFLKMLKHREPIDLTLAAQFCGFAGLDGRDYFEVCKMISEEVLEPMEKQGLVERLQLSHQVVWQVRRDAE